MHSPLPGPQPGNSTQTGPLHFYASPKSTARGRPAIFCVPSLVNRHYILDLHPEASLIAYLNDLGFDCYLLEWPTPKPEDSDKKAEDYVLLLLELLQAHWQEINRPLIALGYCMGGVITLALAQLFSRVQGVALLATPWDYSQYPLAKLTPDQMNLIDSWIESEPVFPAEALQLLLYMTNPYRLYQRFSRFSQEERPEVIKSFIALEHWANDSIPITRGLARECLISWPRQNTLHKGEWKVAGEAIVPSTLNIPAFIAIPDQDHIVPAKVSEPLGQMIPKAVTLRPHAGHVGMIAGMQRMQLWEPLGKWLLSHFRA